MDADRGCSPLGGQRFHKHDPLFRLQRARARANERARRRRDVVVVAPDRDRDVAQRRARAARRIEGIDSRRPVRLRQEKLDPGVRRSLADQVPRDVARGQMASPRQRNRNVRVVLTDAVAHSKGEGCGGEDVGDTFGVGEVPVHEAHDRFSVLQRIRILPPEVCGSVPDRAIGT